MGHEAFIQVALDYDLVQKLLKGLYRGAAGKALKVIISTDGSYHIQSKELRMVIRINAEDNSLHRIDVHNERLSAVITAEDIDAMSLKGLAKNVVDELKDKYSPVFHSLADNIVVFSRAYASNIL